MDCVLIAESYLYSWADFCSRVGKDSARDRPFNVAKAKIKQYLRMTGTRIEVRQKRGGAFYYLIHRKGRVAASNFREAPTEMAAWLEAVKDSFKLLDLYVLTRVQYGEKSQIYEQVKRSRQGRN